VFETSNVTDRSGFIFGFFCIEKPVVASVNLREREICSSTKYYLEELVRLAFIETTLLSTVRVATSTCVTSNGGKPAVAAAAAAAAPAAAPAPAAAVKSSPRAAADAIEEETTPVPPAVGVRIVVVVVAGGGVCSLCGAWGVLAIVIVAAGGGVWGGVCGGVIIAAKTPFQNTPMIATYTAWSSTGTELNWNACAGIQNATM
jgi:hypothetical protein